MRTALSLFLGIIAFGTGGYAWVEGMSVFEAFYMTIITISTVGFGEIRPLSPQGRAITIVVIVTGISIGTYALGQLVRIFVEGELRSFMGRRKLKKSILALRNHYIVCGYGRIGKTICNELAVEHIKFVVIEKNPVRNEELESRGYLYLNMDATSEEALTNAGIQTAKGLITAVRSDAINVFITLTAKALAPDIFVLSRASDETNESKILRAGATRVVSPDLIGARRMAQVIKKPTVVDFIDTAMMSSDLNLAMEEALIRPDSDLVGKSVVESNIRQDFGVIIVAIKKPTGEMLFNPMPSETINAGDVVVVIGKKQELKKLRCVIE